MSVTIITVALHVLTLVCVSVTNWNQSNVINNYLALYYVSVNIQEMLLSKIGGKVIVTCVTGELTLLALQRQCRGQSIPTEEERNTVRGNVMYV